MGVKAAAASMDDFYLPTKLLPPVIFTDATSSRPRVLPRRGPPGTHDVSLCVDVLERIKERNPYIFVAAAAGLKRNGLCVLAGRKETFTHFMLRAFCR